ncbi:MAG: aliphatic sulfonate ABC transporter substrate-binding protein [Rhodospirillaceae bacterium]|nr:aliphatic sulfonate ABC transporter substrate-binding protein [Rhodospirillaceae bacterium]
MLRRTFLSTLAAAAAFTLTTQAFAEDKAKIVGIDWATYNPLSIVLKEKGFLEADLARDGIQVRWVQSLGSNKAIEFLNARGVDFGSTAGSAALLAKINGSPINSVYIYSKPEWTALVTRPDTGIASIEQLKGKRVAVTRGTDPHIFLVRALASKGLTEKDLKIVLLQHPDGRVALDKGDVDAWAGLDPIMAQAEVERGAKLFYRNADANTYGVLNVRSAFAEANPELVVRVLQAYEKARAWAKENPDGLKALLIRDAKISDEVAKLQLTRNDFTESQVGPKPVAAITGAGDALKAANFIPAATDVAAVVKSLVDNSFAQRLVARK